MKLRCQRCGKAFTVKPSLGRRYCSFTCYNLARSGRKGRSTFAWRKSVMRAGAWHDENLIVLSVKLAQSKAPAWERAAILDDFMREGMEVRAELRNRASKMTKVRRRRMHRLYREALVQARKEYGVFLPTSRRKRTVRSASHREPASSMDDV